MFKSIIAKNEYALLGLIPCIAVILGLYIFGNAWISIILYHGSITAVQYAKGIKPARGDMGNIEWLSAGIIIILSALSGLLIYALCPYLFPLRFDGGLGFKLWVYGLDGLSWYLFIAYFVIVNSVSEEYFWRKFLVERVEKQILIDILFGIYHALVLVLFIDLIWAILISIVIIFVSY